MIWTVILKSGESFVVYGTVPSMSEIWKALGPRGIDHNEVAGIVQGNHRVLELPELSALPKGDYYSRITKARQSAMAVPTIRDKADEVAFSKWGPREITNDPVDW